MKNIYKKLESEITKENIKLERVSYGEGRSVKTPEAFVFSLLKYWNHLYDTVYIWEDGSETIHTKCGKNRSLGDVYNITRYYFPKVKLKTVIDTMYGGAIGPHTIGSLFCSTILKQVFYPTMYSSSSIDPITYSLPDYDYYDEELDEYIEAVYTDNEQWILDHYEKYGEADEYGIPINDYINNIDKDKINKNIYNKEINDKIVNLLYNKLIDYINERSELDCREESKLMTVINFITFNNSRVDIDRRNHLIGLVNANTKKGAYND